LERGWNGWLRQRGWKRIFSRKVAGTQRLERGGNGFAKAKRGWCGFL